MRGQKMSIRSSISEELRDSERQRFGSLADDEQEREIEEMLSEKAKRKSYYESKKKFNESRGKGRGFSTTTPRSTGKKNKKKDHGKNSKLGIPIGEYIYYGPGPRPPGPPGIYHHSILEKEEKEEKYKIVRSKGKAYRLEKTLCSHIFRVLARASRPLHVNDLIKSLQKLGLLKEETLHTYAIVYRTLTRNRALFIRRDRATFSLRDGFTKLPRPEPVEKPVEEEENLASLQQLVTETFGELYPNGGGSPSGVFQFLKTMTFNGQYKTIYEAMQSSSFRKDGFNYFLNK